ATGCCRRDRKDGSSGCSTQISASFKDHRGAPGSVHRRRGLAAPDLGGSDQGGAIPRPRCVRVSRHQRQGDGPPSHPGRKDGADRSALECHWSLVVSRSVSLARPFLFASRTIPTRREDPALESRRWRPPLEIEVLSRFGRLPRLPVRSCSVGRLWLSGTLLRTTQTTERLLRSRGHAAHARSTETRKLSSLSAACTMRARGFRKITPKLPAGTAKLPSRATRKLNTIWASCIAKAKESRRTTPK